MNQILATEKTKKSNKQTDIKNIIMFFAISLIIFGIVLSGEGTYAIYKSIEDTKPSNIPKVTIQRVNDEAIVNIKHNKQIMKISYSWDNGEENVVPINDYTAQETITLLEHNSTLKLIVEDITGKQITYQEEFLLDGVDITKPTIQINTSNGSNKMVIIAKDETAMLRMTYQWEGEEEKTFYAETNNEKELTQELILTPGSKIIRVIAEDLNGNIEEIEKEVVISTSKPTMSVLKDGNQVIFEAKDQDGIKDILVNLNGETYSAKDINLKEVKVGPLTLKEGNNILSIEVTNVNGYTESAATELMYNSQ